MESTGVYWIPVYEILEARGFRVHLVNARHLKHAPGRKSDVKACQWIQPLHTCGLLSGAFRPEAEMCAVRAYLAIGRPCWSLGRRIFSTCKRRCTR
jgi:transposase